MDGCKNGCMYIYIYTYVPKSKQQKLARVVPTHCGGTPGSEAPGGMPQLIVFVASLAT